MHSELPACVTESFITNVASRISSFNPLSHGNRAAYDVVYDFTANKYRRPFAQELSSTKQRLRDIQEDHDRVENNIAILESRLKNIYTFLINAQYILDTVPLSETGATDGEQFDAGANIGNISTHLPKQDELLAALALRAQKGDFTDEEAARAQASIS